MSGVRVKSQIEVPRSKFHLDLEGIHAALKTCASEILNKLESQTAAEWTFHRIQVWTSDAFGMVCNSDMYLEFD